MSMGTPWTNRKVEPLQEWRVRTPNKVRPWRNVTAGYLVIEHGHLIFRIPGTGFPKTVHIFAPGNWMEVKNATTQD